MVGRRKTKDFMDMVDENKRAPVPKGGALGFGTWEGALKGAKKAPSRRR